MLSATRPCMQVGQPHNKTARVRSSATRARLAIHEPHVRLATKTSAANFDSFAAFVSQLQESILKDAERLDGSGKTFVKDYWEREAGNPHAGHGLTCVLEGGDLLEKAAANVSIVRGTLTPARAQAMTSRGRRGVDPQGGQPYAAAAMSLVFHPSHPMVPTLRGDVRLFQVAGHSWFGGGCDLTPSYLFQEDAVEFHTFWKGVCDAHHPSIYPKCKEWCDKYFYLPARKEHRGIGGIFFDDLSSHSDHGSDDPDGGELLPYNAESFTREVGARMLDSWHPIVHRRRGMAYTQAQRNWQLMRRGRYLEFNLLYDRGVRFGLDGGRVESIMVSAPPLAAWKYNAALQPGSPEAELCEVLARPKQWVDYH